MVMQRQTETWEDSKGKRWRKQWAEPFQRFCVGVDLGQSQDYTAIAVIDHSVTPLNETEDDSWDVDEYRGIIKQKVDEYYDVRHLERRPLGELYPDQIAHVNRLLCRPPLRDREVPVCFDTTSNIAAVDIAEQRGIKPIRITFTSGHEPIGQGRKWGVPKALLVSTLDAKLHTKQLRISPELLASEALKEELSNLQKHVSQTGKLLFEHRSGRHDDLVFAICMPLWWTIERSKHGGLRIYGSKGLY
jgi:hypothetical protein